MSILEILSNVRDDVDFANSSNFIDDGYWIRSIS